MSKKTAFLSTVFPIDESYLFDFLDSLNSQTYKDFDLIIVNDGYENFTRIKDKYLNLNIVELKYSDTPVKNREYGINFCIENSYDILIFGDSDDYFENNRIEKSIELLSDSDIVVNDLSLFDENGIYEKKYISNRIDNLSIIDLEFIKDKNIFGLSNTAISLKDINKVSLPNTLIVVDWYLFTLFLLYNKKAIFTNETVSYYRQHQQNIAGLKELNVESFNRGLEIKKKHFLALSDITNIYDLEIERFSKINQMKDDEKLVKSKIKNPLWWELI